jgi:hypothetical protein
MAEWANADRHGIEKESISKDSGIAAGSTRLGGPVVSF